MDNINEWSIASSI